MSARSALRVPRRWRKSVPIAAASWSPARVGSPKGFVRHCRNPHHLTMVVRIRTIVTLSILAIVLGAAAPAQGAVSCGFAAGTATVSMSAAGDSAAIAVGTGVNAGRIVVGVTPCGLATTLLTDTIVVNGSTGAENVTIDLSGGQFAPGIAVEGSGLSEIELVVDF